MPRDSGGGVRHGVLAMPSRSWTVLSKLTRCIAFAKTMWDVVLAEAAITLRDRVDVGDLLLDFCCENELAF